MALTSQEHAEEYADIMDNISLFEKYIKGIWSIPVKERKKIMEDICKRSRDKIRADILTLLNKFAKLENNLRQLSAEGNLRVRNCNFLC
jgi:hypothetical protein